VSRSRSPTARYSKPRLEQVRVLAQPLRLRLFELFAESPRTTKQAADALELPPTRLYHHVAALERVGLLRLRETRRNRGTIEKYYEAAQSRIAMDEVRLGGRAPAGALAQQLIDRAGEDMTAALEGLPASTPPGQRPLGARAIIHTSPRRLAALRARIEALVAELSACPEPRGKEKGVRATVTIVFAPAVSR
jgi:hypothetical protein